MEIGVVGSENFVLGFKLIGIRKTLIVNNSEEYEDKLFDALSDKEIGILVIDAKDLNKLDSTTQKKLTDSIEPTVIAIGAEEDITLREKIKQAVGVDLWR